MVRECIGLDDNFELANLEAAIWRVAPGDRISIMFRFQDAMTEDPQDTHCSCPVESAETLGKSLLAAVAEARKAG